MALFALDHNYPAPIIGAAAPYLDQVELEYIGDIDPRLPEFDDWELLLALHHDERPWDGMVTNDTSILSQEVELAVLGYTRLTLVAPQAAGHDPIRSTGLVLAHIENIAARTTTAKPQVWKLGSRTQPAEHPDEFLDGLAKRRGVVARELREQSLPTKEVLERNPLA